MVADFRNKEEVTLQTVEKKKQGKKKEGGNIVYEYYIPYYTSTHKPYIKDDNQYHVKSTIVSYIHHTTTTTTYKPGRKESYNKVEPILEKIEQIKYKRNEDSGSGSGGLWNTLRKMT